MIGTEFVFDSFVAFFLCVFTFEIYLTEKVCRKFYHYMVNLGQLLQTLGDFTFLYVYICGDFNAYVLSHSMFGNEVRRLCSDNLLCLSDTLLLTSITFTFIGSIVIR